MQGMAGVLRMSTSNLESKGCLLHVWCVAYELSHGHGHGQGQGAPDSTLKLSYTSYTYMYV